MTEVGVVDGEKHACSRIFGNVLQMRFENLHATLHQILSRFFLAERRERVPDRNIDVVILARCGDSRFGNVDHFLITAGIEQRAA